MPKRFIRKPKPKKKKPPPKGVGGFFLRGVITVLPVILTFVVFGLLFQMVNRYVTGPINSTIYWSIEGNGLGWKLLDRFGIDPLQAEYLDPELLPLELQTLARRPEGFAGPEFLDRLSVHRNRNLGFFRDLDDLAIRRERLRQDVTAHIHPLIGVFLSLLLVLWLGWLVGGFVGRRIVGKLDDAMQLIPVVKSVYPYSKQLVEFFFAEKQIEFDTVVAIPYPSPGIWSIAFITSSSLKTLREETGKELVSAFVPSSPMPMTGYTVFIEPDRIIPLPISIDEALRITMTGGVLIPPNEKVDDLFDELTHKSVEEVSDKPIPEEESSKEGSG
jgi:uncharacterized membrane protein